MIKKTKQRSNKNMATATAVPTSAKFTVERFEVAYGFQTIEKKEKDGTVITTKEPVMLSPEAAEKLSDENKFEGSVFSVAASYPQTFEGLIELANTPAVDDDGTPREQKEVQDEIIKLFNNGAKSKVMNRLRAKVTKVDDAGKLTFKEPPEGEVLDLTGEITSGSKRIFLTEEQKTWKGLANLPGAVREQVWRAYLTAVNKEFYLPAE